MVLLFDAAYTLIHKPQLFIKIMEVLSKNKIDCDELILKRNHKLISELFEFPDKTSKLFYDNFNKELLYSLGIFPFGKLLDEMFESCSYLPWEPYSDTKYIESLKIEKAIISNFHNGLNKIVNTKFPNIFKNILISENEKVRKPSLEFYKRAIDKLKCNPSEIIYIGDSIKLDIEPALKLGMNAWLIDRNENYLFCSRRLNSLKELSLEKLLS